MRFEVTILFVFLFMACGSKKRESPLRKKQKIDIPVEVAILEKYILDAPESEMNWSRSLDQKPTEQKLKVLGSNVKMNLGNVTMTSTGAVKLKTGILEVIDHKIDRARVTFDMATFKLAEEKGEGLFDVKKFPEGHLQLQNFRKDTSGFKADGKLTLQEVTRTVNVQLFKASMDTVKVLKGQLVFNTMDFPLRDKVTKDKVRKDEVTVMFAFTFNP